MRTVAVDAIEVCKLVYAIAKLLGQKASTLGRDKFNVVILRMYADDIVAKTGRH